MSNAVENVKDSTPGYLGETFLSVTQFFMLAFLLPIYTFLIMPKILGSKVKINALITILAVLVGGALCGFSGMFLAIPFVAILKIVFDRVEGMKPWGMLLGDDITGTHPNRFIRKLKQGIRKKPSKAQKIPS